MEQLKPTEWKAEDLELPSEKQLKEQERFYNRLTNLIENYFKKYEE